jgi:hypothetical protein
LFRYYLLTPSGFNHAVPSRVGSSSENISVACLRVLYVLSCLPEWIQLRMAAESNAVKKGKETRV